MAGSTVVKAAHLRNWIPDRGWNAIANDGIIGEVSDGGALFRDSDVDDTPDGIGRDGDGLTAFEEYRGFMVRGEHRRTDTKYKDVFIDSDLPINIGYAVNLPVTKHWVRPEELSLVSPLKVVNTNFSNSGVGGNIPARTDQHGIVVRDMASAPVGPILGNARCAVPCTPNKGDFNTTTVLASEIYTSSIAAAAPDADAWYRGMMKTTGHEIGHKIGMSHYDDWLSTSRRTVMISGFDWANSTWTNIPSTYDQADNSQIKVKGQ